MTVSSNFFKCFYNLCFFNYSFTYTYQCKSECFTMNFCWELDIPPSMLHEPWVCSIWEHIEPVEHHVMSLLCVVNEQWMVAAWFFFHHRSSYSGWCRDGLEESDWTHIINRNHNFLFLRTHAVTHNVNNSYDLQKRQLKSKIWLVKCTFPRGAKALKISLSHSFYFKGSYWRLSSERSGFKVKRKRWISFLVKTSKKVFARRGHFFKTGPIHRD